MMLAFDRPYCLLNFGGRTFYGTGRVSRQQLLRDLPRPGALPVVSMVPYTQLRERGYAVHDGSEPILSLALESYSEIDPGELGRDRSSVVVELTGSPAYDMSDAEFESRVQRLITDEIARGEGANFLLSRKCRVQLADFRPAVANEIFLRLVANELGAYLTFCFFDGERYFVGSSPERHLTLERGVVRMNPISGTLPKSELGTRSDLVEFLLDAKEINELFQVVDEELKMMSRICSAGGSVHGPYLKEMSTLFHTEYVLEGRSDLSAVDAFRHSMFAATMIGSPLENAARVIKKYEGESRRYYAGAIAIRGLDAEGREYLDSAITIRTMEVEADGRAVIQSGASIVRDSVPAKECREIKAKAAGLLRAIESPQPSAPILERFLDAELESLLQHRNEFLSRFWLKKQQPTYREPRLASQSILIIDNEDEFAQMLLHVIRHLGLRPTVRRYDQELDLAGFDYVLVGPGPGDPTNHADPKIARVRGIVQRLLDERRRFLAVCLGHQILCDVLGFDLAPVNPPLQGVQKAIDLFGRLEAVGFYNTFFGRTARRLPPDIEISTEPDGRVVALRSPSFYSLQFHPESLLTTNSIPIIKDALLWLAGAGQRTVVGDAHP